MPDEVIKSIDQQIDEWYADRSRGLISYIKWAVKSAKYYSDKPKKYPQYTWNLEYWAKQRQNRLKIVKQTGKRVLAMRDPATRTKIKAMLAGLEAAGFVLHDMHRGYYEGKLAAIRWQIDVKGPALRVYRDWKQVYTATYYTRLVVHNKTLDSLLGD